MPAGLGPLEKHFYITLDSSSSVVNVPALALGRHYVCTPGVGKLTDNLVHNVGVISVCCFLCLCTLRLYPMYMCMFPHLSILFTYVLFSLCIICFTSLWVVFMISCTVCNLSFTQQVQCLTGNPLQLNDCKYVSEFPDVVWSFHLSVTCVLNASSQLKFDTLFQKSASQNHKYTIQRRVNNMRIRPRRFI